MRQRIVLNASEVSIEEVFALFNDSGAWLVMALPQASNWIEAGLGVRFDADFCALLRSYADDDERSASFCATP